MIYDLWDFCVTCILYTYLDTILEIEKYYSEVTTLDKGLKYGG